MKSLDFMIVGMQKSGTTALASFLSEHPALAVASGKEVHLFDSPSFSSSWGRNDIDAIYAACFEGSQARLFGEATPIYTYFRDIPAMLAAYNPRLKLIILLRDPAARAVSQYWMERTRGDETLPLPVAFLLEPARLLIDVLFKKKRIRGSHSRTHSYISRGHYTAQINNVLRHFPSEQILVVDNESLLADHVATMQGILSFLEVSLENIAPPQKVFAGEYSAHSFGLVRLLLDAYFWPERKRLKRLLLKLNNLGGWRWLG